MITIRCQSQIQLFDLETIFTEPLPGVQSVGMQHQKKKKKHVSDNREEGVHSLHQAPLTFLR